MLNITTSLQLLSIVYAILSAGGVVLVAYAAYSGKKRTDGVLLRARAFLNESFMKDSWTLLLLACSLFFIDSLLSLNMMFGSLIELNISILISILVEAGTMVCIVMLAYKWFRLVNPKNQM